MRRRGVLVVVALAASMVGAISEMSLGRAARAEACGRDRVSAIMPRSAVARGVGLPAVVGGRTIAVVGSGASRDTFAPPAGAGVVRHVVARPGSGTAFVLDRRGPDAVEVVTSHGTIRLDQPAEATNPAWSPDGRLIWSLGSNLRIWSASSSSTFHIAAPPNAIGVFSPVFTGSDAVVAVVAEPEPGFSRTEDEGVDNLWRYDLAARRWTRLTSFRARGDRWVAIRTPVAAHDGSVEFVLVRGSSSAAGIPPFELWRLSRAGIASKVRDLSREMYLAGILGGRRVWNVYDVAGGEWRLYAERSPSELVGLGCGATLVDPRSVNDPDRTPSVRTEPTQTPTPDPSPTVAPSPTPDPTLTPTPTSSPTDDYIAGILVGDFATLDPANDALAQIQAEFSTAPIEVVNSFTAPNIVRPGVWAVVMLIAHGADPSAALSDFRARLPQYQDQSWVVSV